MTGGRVLGDSWYADELPIDSLGSVASGAVWRRLLGSPVGRGLALWWFGRRYDVTVTVLAGRATRVMLVLERLFGPRRRHIVLLEFIPVVGTDARAQWGSSGRLRGSLSQWYWERVVAPVLREGLLAAQSLTRWESERNALHFAAEPSRFRFIPFFSDVEGPTGPAPQRGRGGVLASGRAACDWETVFAAARGADWPLTVVCSTADAERVNRLNGDRRATVLSEISRTDHAALMAAARVYLLALKEAEVSSGHVRLAEAATAGTAVVASAVRGVEDYLVAGETAMMFAPGDADAARAAVTLLNDDESLREHLVSAARRRCANWGRADYLAAVAAMLDEVRVEASTASARRSSAR